jgi:hypothetical protein
MARSRATSEPVRVFWTQIAPEAEWHATHAPVATPVDGLLVMSPSLAEAHAAEASPVPFGLAATSAVLDLAVSSASVCAQLYGGPAGWGLSSAAVRRRAFESIATVLADVDRRLDDDPREILALVHPEIEAAITAAMAVALGRMSLSPAGAIADGRAPAEVFVDSVFAVCCFASTAFAISRRR